MSRRTAIAAARDSGVRIVHCFLVTDLATLRVRIDITGGRTGSGMSAVRGGELGLYRETVWVLLFRQCLLVQTFLNRSETPLPVRLHDRVQKE